MDAIANAIPIPDTCQSRSSSTWSPDEYVRDIDLGFPIYAPSPDGRLRVGLSNEQWALLQRIFPDTFAVCLCPPYLVFRVKTLPPKPWPITVGGEPVHLTTSATDNGYPHKRGGLAQPILSDTHHSTHQPREIMLAAAKELRRINFRVHSITIYGYLIAVELVDDIAQAERRILPGRIASKLAQYAKKDERSVEECYYRGNMGLTFGRKAQGTPYNTLQNDVSPIQITPAETMTFNICQD